MATTDPAHEPADPSRRDFIHIMAVAAAVGGVAAVAWPLVDQMNPSADVLAEGSPITVDLSKVEPGQQIVVLWRKTAMPRHAGQWQFSRMTVIYTGQHPAHTAQTFTEDLWYPTTR